MQIAYNVMEGNECLGTFHSKDDIPSRFYTRSRPQAHKTYKGKRVHPYNMPEPSLKAGLRIVEVGMIPLSDYKQLTRGLKDTRKALAEGQSCIRNIERKVTIPKGRGGQLHASGSHDSGQELEEQRQLILQIARPLQQIAIATSAAFLSQVEQETTKRELAHCQSHSSWWQRLLGSTEHEVRLKKKLEVQKRESLLIANRADNIGIDAIRLLSRIRKDPRYSQIEQDYNDAYTSLHQEIREGQYESEENFLATVNPFLPRSLRR